MACYKDREFTRQNHLQNKFTLKSAAMLLVVLTSAFLIASHGAAMAEETPPATDDLTLFNRGTIAPSFSLERLSGGRITLSDLHGKVVMLDFWATW